MDSFAVLSINQLKLGFMRKIILYILGVLVLALAVWVSYLLVSREKVKRPTPVRQVKTVFVDTVRNAAVPIAVNANGNLIASFNMRFHKSKDLEKSLASRLAWLGQTT